MPNIAMIARKILEFYEKNIEHVDKQMKENLNKSEYIYLDLINESNNNLKDLYLNWSTAFFRIKTFFEEENSEDELNILFDAIQNIFMITPELIERLEKATKYIKEDLQKYTFKQSLRF